MQVSAKPQKTNQMLEILFPFLGPFNNTQKYTRQPDIKNTNSVRPKMNSIKWRNSEAPVKRGITKPKAKIKPNNEK